MKIPGWDSGHNVWPKAQPHTMALSIESMERSRASMREAEQRSADYAAGLLDNIATMGMSSEQVRQYQVAQQAAAAPTAALAKLITDLGAKYETMAKVGREAADVQKTVNDQQSDAITTLHDLNIIIPTVFENAAFDMGEAADAARALRFDIEDIAGAINNNDWTSAFAGLINVLAKVDVALGKNATSLQKMQALAGVGMGVGSVIGGTAGAGISGAASGALAGFQAGSIIPGLGNVAGAVIGGLVGGLGSIFGSSKAKKQAKRQAEAQRAAEEAARQQQIADAKYSIDLALLQAQGKATEALAFQRQHELDALTKLDPSLVDLQKQLYAAQDAADAAAKAAEVKARADDIQARIDKLTLSSTELLAKTRAKERAEAVALDASLGPLLDQFYALEDAQAAQAAVTQALSKASSDAAESHSQQLAALQAMNDAATQAIANLTGLSKSLREFAGQVGDQAGIGGGYSAARSAFLSASASGNITDLQAYGEAFLKASEARFGNSREYMRDAALVRSAALAGANLADMRLGAIGQVFGNLPGFASGGSMVIGGNPGIDQNVLSINGQPQAFVGAGELLTVTPRGASNDNSSAALRSEVQALRQEVASLRSETRRGADAAEETFDLLRAGVITVRQG